MGSRALAEEQEHPDRFDDGIASGAAIDEISWFAAAAVRSRLIVVECELSANVHLAHPTVAALEILTTA